MGHVTIKLRKKMKQETFLAPGGGDTLSFATYLGAHSWSQDITLRFSFSVSKSYPESGQVTRAQNQKSEDLVRLLQQSLEGLDEWLNCRMDTSSPSL